MKKLKHLFALTVSFAVVLFAGCDNDKPAATAPAPAPGGAIKSAGATTDPVARGKELFASKTCAACHQMDAKVVGPPLRGIVAKRGEEWVHRMIQSPEQMVKEDATAKALLDEYKTPMPNMSLSDDDVSAIIAYLKSEG